MSRVLVLLVAIIFFRTFLGCKRRRSMTATSPYMNSLDSLLSAEELSVALNEMSEMEKLSHGAGVSR